MVRTIHALLIPLFISFAFGCAGPALETVRPVQPGAELQSTLTWPDFVGAEDAAALERAEQRIEQVRKGELLVRVVDTAGKPVPKAHVRWVQQSRDFHFGVAAPFNARVWGDLLRIGVNHVAAALDWNATEPEPNVWTDGAAAAAHGLDILPQMGAAARGSAAVWMTPGLTPAWVRGLDRAALLTAVDRHVRTLAHNLKGHVAYWEALNEPNAEWSDAVGRDPGFVVDIAAAAVQGLRDIDPLTPILISFNHPMGERQGLKPLHFCERLRAADVDFDIVGLSYYYNGYSKTWTMPRRTLPDIGANLDDLALAGKPIHITGVSVPSRIHPTDPSLAGHWTKRWSPELQAVYLKAFYITAFSRAAVQAITWRDALDEDAHIVGGGLFATESEPKPAFFALRDLLARWRTEGDGSTDDNGELRLRGFGGGYRVIVTDPASRRELLGEAHITERELDVVTITVPDEIAHPEKIATPWVVVTR